MSFLPEQPDFAGMLGQQVLTLETLGDGETLRAFPHQHDVPGMLHYCFGEE